MADITRQEYEGRECIIVERTDKWVTFQVDMILIQQPPGILTAFSADDMRWIGYIRPEGPSLAELKEMPEADTVIRCLRELSEMTEKLFLDPCGFPLDPSLWFYTDGQLACVYVPEGLNDDFKDAQEQKEKTAFMFLANAALKKSPEHEINAYYRYYLEAAGIHPVRKAETGEQPERDRTAGQGPFRYSLPESWTASSYTADISPAELSGESLPDLLGGEEPDTDRGNERRGLFRRRDKKRK